MVGCVGKLLLRGGKRQNRSKGWEEVKLRERGASNYYLVFTVLVFLFRDFNSIGE